MAAPAKAAAGMTGGKDAYDGAHNGASPAAPLGLQLVLAEMDVALLVLGDDPDVVGADKPQRVEVLDHLVIGFCCRLVRVGGDVNEDCFWLCHVVPLVPVTGRSS